MQPAGSKEELIEIICKHLKCISTFYTFILFNKYQIYFSIFDLNVNKYMSVEKTRNVRSKLYISIVVNENT